MRDFFSIETAMNIGRLCIAQLSIVFLLAVDVMHLGFYKIPLLQTSFLTMGLFYWLVYRPTLTPLWWVGVLAVIYSAIFGFSFGLSLALYGVLYFFVTRKRLYFMGQSYFVLWAGFGFVLTLFFIAQLFLFAVMNGGSLLPCLLYTSPSPRDA